MLYIPNHSKLNPGKRSFDLQKDLQHCGLQISATTLHRRLLEVGRKTIKTPNQTCSHQNDQAKPVSLGKEVQQLVHRKLEKSFFSDETYFFEQEWHGKHVGISKGVKLSPMHLNQTVKHSQKKLFWDCFSFPGVGTLTPVEEMTNSDCYTELIRRTVTRDMQRSFLADGGVLQ